MKIRTITLIIVASSVLGGCTVMKPLSPWDENNYYKRIFSPSKTKVPCNLVASNVDVVGCDPKPINDDGAIDDIIHELRGPFTVEKAGEVQKALAP